ncbi:MAG: glutaminyl-peptide cyclotransferase, partial [Abditibacteriaceae bacterium]
MKRLIGILVASAALVVFPIYVAAQIIVKPLVMAVADAPQLQYKVVAQFPHDPSAFTEGLFWDKDNLYESTGLLGHSTLRKVDLQSGKVLLQHRLPDDVFGEGIAEMSGKLVQLTWQKQRAYLYDFNNFNIIGNLNYQGEGWGLTTDGKSWISSNGSDTLIWRDEKTFAPQRFICVTWNSQPVRNLNELEWIDGKIWANVWYTDWILQIDPQSGKVLSYIDITSL